MMVAESFKEIVDNPAETSHKRLMFLPPWLWRVIENKRTKAILICLPFVGLAAAVIFHGTMNQLGEHRLKNHIDWLESKGLMTDLDDAFPPVENPDEDRLQHPAMIYELGLPLGQRLGRVENSVLAGRLSGVEVADFPPRRDFAERWDLVAIFNPVRHANETEAAKEVISALSSEITRLRALHDAMKRKNVAWQIEWNDAADIGVSYPHLTQLWPFVGISSFSQDVGLAHMAMGDMDAVRREMDFQFGLMDSLSQNPMMISIMALGLPLSALESMTWEGVSRQLWTDADLAGLERMLSRQDMQSLAILGLRGESAQFVAMAKICSEMKRARMLALSDGWALDRDIIPKRIRGLCWAYRPDGVDQMKLVKSSREFFEIGLRDHGVKRTRFSLEDLNEFIRREAAVPTAIMGGWNLYLSSEDPALEGGHWFSMVLIARIALRLEARVALLRTGIALERYRLRHLSHPDHLDALVPAYLPEVPIDPYDMKPLKYRLQADGSPWVWSIGEDGKDESGLPHEDVMKGDRVWITQPIPGFDETNYRR